LTVATWIVSTAPPPTPPPGPQTVPTDSMTKLDAVFIGVGAVVAILVVALIIGLVWFFRPSKRRVQKLLGPSAGARSAYERGDYWRVCALVTNRKGPQDAKSLSDQLLLAAACDQLGGVESSEKAFKAAVDLLPDDTNEANKKTITSLSSWEQLIFTDLAQRFPASVAEVALDADTDIPPKQTNFLARLRQRVNQQRLEAKKHGRWYTGINVVLGALAAVAAAGAGISGVSGFPKVLIGILALASAAISTVLITLKPAETAEVDKKTTLALEDLLAEIDLFETSGCDDPNETRKAQSEAQNRLSAAKNRPRLIPLIEPSDAKTDTVPEKRPDEDIHTVAATITGNGSTDNPTDDT
jgi:hypothetical protein